MADPTFDVLFSGELLGSASPDYVKKRLAQIFKLDEAGVERLFSGQRVFVKRGVDFATAERLREVFDKAGALAEVVPVGGDPDEVFHFDDSDDEADVDASPSAAKGSTITPSSSPPSSSPPSSSPPSSSPPSSSPPSASWSIAPPGAELEELSDRGPEQHPDISKLSLVEDDD
ncbi:hypothetical protein [Thiorhodovibrio frisius]|uniref:Uncharacterized protein n=1 Tax=Thiorhodovibrio frisius TaxID=631362 RepID=H8Z5Z9_9GAMM|nr:hypothetical protein [Thiorhodovibrio frisius]EIC20649.1 hypothetical protein Thi970DRAFT_04303 [Thiorhodovibrio frisius]WPL21397.1 Tfp pilus assembly protein, major pilin PilA [Thiorhodovibrio frisius]